MNWTERQLEAIENRQKNILVAAAAGSGKTAVLVERIRRLIVEDRVPVDRMLIVTFTNAAAAEMKEKIRQALYAEQNEDRTKAAYARRQLALLPQASISTFHSFALSVIRKYFYLTDLEPGFSICDEARGAILREDAMDELLEKRFEEGSPEFHDFLDRYSSGRNMNGVREMILSVYDGVMAMPYPWKWLDEKIGELGLSCDEFRKSPLMEYIWDHAAEALTKAAENSRKAAEILEGEGLDRLADKVREGQTVFTEAALEYGKTRDFEGFGEKLGLIGLPRITPKKEEKEIYAEVKDSVSACLKEARETAKNLREEIFCRPLDAQVEEMNRTAPFAAYLGGLVREYHEIFRAVKKKKKLADFSDIEHYCLEILENPDARDFYRDKFEYIFIDEYQDTNVLQEEIIGRICRENNLFMVGDIKQSIYRFRLAEPSIFRRKYRQYAGCGAGDSSVKIDLNRNYRSKAVVLEGINRVFRDAMEGYDADAELYPGIEYDGPLSYEPEMTAVAFGGTADDGEEAKAVPEEIADLKKTEIEALQAANIIKESLGKEYMDPKTGKVRRLHRRDIVILLRSVRNYADVYYGILKRCGIDAYVDDNEGYFDTMEIRVFMNLLSVIDNKKQDVPLISVLHSEIFGFTADRLAQVREEHKTGSFEEALRTYAQAHPESETGSMCADALSSIEGWKRESRIMPLGRFVWKLMIETGYYIVMGAMPGGSQRQANLRALVDKAEDFASDGQGTLYDFMRYIDSVKKRKVRTGQVRLIGEKDDVVRIMTIHKSKGLEFPMVILAGCGKRLNYSKAGRGASLHKDIGIGLTLENPEERWYSQTLIQRLIAGAVRREEAEEEVRILYVAMTRAKDVLHILGTVNDGEKYLAARESGVRKDTDYLSIIGDTVPCTVVNAADVDGSGLSEKVYAGGDILNRDIYAGHSDEETKADVIRRLEYAYPYEGARRLKPKYSVSELNSEASADDEKIDSGRLGPESEEPMKPVWRGFSDLKAPDFMAGKKKLTAAERGTCFHTLMENLDFAKAAEGGYEYVASEVERLKACGIFTEEEAASVYIKGVTAFFESDTGARAAKAFAEGRMRKEKPFTLLSEKDGESVMIQGIIDCYFIEDGRAVIIDYKTNRFDKSRAEEEIKRLTGSYGKQIEIYRDAVVRATGVKECEAYLYVVQAGRFVGINEQKEGRQA